MQKGKSKTDLEPDPAEIFNDKIFSFKTMYESFAYFMDQRDKRLLASDKFFISRKNYSSIELGEISEIKEAKKQISKHYIKKAERFALAFNNFKNYKSQKYLNALYPEFEFELKSIALSNNQTFLSYLFHTLNQSKTEKNIEQMLVRAKRKMLG